MTGADLCQQALQAAMLLGAGEEIRGEQSDDVLAVVNRVLDDFQGDSAFCFAERFDQFVITPNHNPHTVGPGGDFVYSVRPNTIEAAAVVITTLSPNVKIPIRMVDWQWFWRQAVPSVTSIYEVVAYYQPDFGAAGRGSLYLWPVPSIAYGIELWTKTVISQLTLNGTFSMPPGYLSAVIFTSGEQLCPMFDQEPPAMLVKNAADARRRVKSANSTIPTLQTRDSGMPQAGKFPTFNWKTGLYNNSSR